MQASKVSISLNPVSARFVEEYQRQHALKSRSEVIERALRILREQELEAAYREAAADEAAFLDLDAALADGLDDEAW